MKKLFKAAFALIAVFITVIETQAQVLESSTPTNGLFADNGTIDKKPVPYPPLRQSDVLWRKTVWREIDFRQKINLPFYYPIEPHDNWKSFITIIMDALKEGKITAYDPIQIDELSVPLTYSDVISAQSDSTIQRLQRPEPPYEEYDTVIVSEFDNTKVMRLRLKEVWYFDKQLSQLHVRIIAFCPVYIKIKDGTPVTEPLFWIYFPESRPILAKEQSYNPSNSARRRTYDEIFWKRMFSSYIYKVENVYDRRISEYATGVDALLESEKIKKEISDFEFELWEY
ncbi:MAG: gliding motility protein GldN [Hyphomicrobiales bacterium]